MILDKTIFKKGLQPLVLAPIIASSLVFSTPSYAQDPNSTSKSQEEIVMPWTALGEGLSNLGIKFSPTKDKTEPISEVADSKPVIDSKPIEIPECYDPNNPKFSDPIIMGAVSELNGIDKPDGTGKKLEYCPTLIMPNCDNKGTFFKNPPGVNPINVEPSCSKPVEMVSTEELAPPVFSPKVPLVDIPTPVLATNSTLLVSNPLVTPPVKGNSNNILSVETPIPTAEPIKPIVTESPKSTAAIIPPKKPVVDTLTPKPTHVEERTQIPKYTNVNGYVIKKEPQDDLLALIAKACGKINPKTGEIDTSNAITYYNVHAVAELNDLYSNPNLKDMIIPEVFEFKDSIEILNQMIERDTKIPPEVHMPDNCSNNLEDLNPDNVNSYQLNYELDIKVSSPKVTSYTVVSGDSVPIIAKKFGMSKDEYLTIAECTKGKCTEDNNFKLGKIWPGDVLEHTEGEIFSLGYKFINEEDSKKVIARFEEAQNQIEEEVWENKKQDFIKKIINAKDLTLETLLEVGGDISNWFNKEVNDNINSYNVASKFLAPYLESSTSSLDEFTEWSSDKFNTYLTEISNNKDLQRSGLWGLMGLFWAGALYRGRKKVIPSLSKAKDITSKNILVAKDYLEKGKSNYVPAISNLAKAVSRNILSVENSLEEKVLDYFLSIPDLTDLGGKNIFDKYDSSLGLVTLDGEYESELWETDYFRINENENFKEDLTQGENKSKSRSNLYLKNTRLVLEYLLSKTLNPLLEKGIEKVGPVLTTIKENPKTKFGLKKINRAKRKTVIDYKRTKKDINKLGKVISAIPTKGLEHLITVTSVPFASLSKTFKSISQGFNNFVEEKSEKSLNQYFENLLEDNGFPLDSKTCIKSIMDKGKYSSIREVSDFLDGMSNDSKTEYCANMVMELANTVYDQNLENLTKNNLNQYFENLLKDKGFPFDPNHYIALTMVKEGCDSARKVSDFFESMGNDSKEEYCANMIMELADEMYNHNQVLGHIVYILGSEKMDPIIGMANMAGIRLKSKIESQAPNGDRYIPNSTITKTYGMVRKLEKSLSIN